jgi:hypothetical protein
MKCHYPSLEGLPDTRVDEYGNLGVVSRREGEGLRHRFEYALALAPEHLAGRILSELLDWLRWGSQTGVMWEASGQELVDLINRWEAANPAAGHELYLGREPVPVTWDQVWARTCRQGTRRVGLCPNGHGEFGDFFGQCRECGANWYDDDVRKAEMGPRGIGTYNTATYGVGGGSIAAAAFYSKGDAGKRVAPAVQSEFELSVALHNAGVPLSVD